MSPENLSRKGKRESVKIKELREENLKRKNLTVINVSFPTKESNCVYTGIELQK